MDKPLSGIRVLELAEYVAGPTCARLLADLGASVVKVERTRGDLWRETGKGYAAHFNDLENPVFDIYNSGKSFISLNLKSEKGMEAFKRILAQTDVFVTNTRPGALARLGIAYEQLKDEYPRLVYAALLGYGEKGPDANIAAFDSTAFWTRSGFMRDMALRTEQYAPLCPPSAVGDALSGMFLMGEICAALYRRERTGRGDYVRSGLYHNAIFAMGTMSIINHAPDGAKYPITRLEYGIPTGPYRSKDNEWLFISTGNVNDLIPKFCNMIGHPEYASEPRFADRKVRKENAAETCAMLNEIMAQKTLAEWKELARIHDVPITRMNHFKDVYDDEQAWANEYVEHVTFPNGAAGMMPTSPIDMDSVGEVKTRHSKAIGADTADVLREFGYSDAEIAAMKENGDVR